MLDNKSIIIGYSGHAFAVADSYIANGDTLNFYADLKEAHVNTIIGVDKEQVYKDMPKFKTVNEYELYRQKNMSEGLTEKESLQYIADIEAAEKKQAVEMSYNLLKREEEMKKKQKEFNSRFLMLSN